MLHARAAAVPNVALTEADAPAACVVATIERSIAATLRPVPSGGPTRVPRHLARPLVEVPTSLAVPLPAVLAGQPTRRVPATPNAEVDVAAHPELPARVPLNPARAVRGVGEGPLVPLLPSMAVLAVRGSDGRAKGAGSVVVAASIKTRDARPQVPSERAPEA